MSKVEREKLEKRETNGGRASPDVQMVAMCRKVAEILITYFLFLKESKRTFNHRVLLKVSIYLAAWHF